MNTKQFHYVLVLAREGSFSRAADALSISQPSLSQYIKKIEKDVGTELFNRTGGDVRLTDAGQVYIDVGRRILELERGMENAFSDLAAHKRGSLVIGAAPYRAAGMMPAIARAFQERHPGMHLVVREATTWELAEGMEHGEYDIALTLLPVDRRLFQCEKVMEEELILAAPAARPPMETVSMPGRRYPAVRAEILDGCPMVMLTRTQFMQRQLEELTADAGVMVNTAAVVKSLEAQIEMVKAGVGMALVPSGIERFCSDGSVTFYSFVDPLPKREVVVMWRKDRKLSQAAEELKDVIRSIKW